MDRKVETGQLEAGKTPDQIMRTRLEKVEQRLTRLGDAGPDDGTRSYRRRLATRRRIGAEVGVREYDLMIQRVMLDVEDSAQVALPRLTQRTIAEREGLVSLGVALETQRRPKPQEVIGNIRKLAKMADRMPRFGAHYDLTQDSHEQTNWLNKKNQSSTLSDIFGHSPEQNELIETILGENAALMHMSLSELMNKYQSLNTDGPYVLFISGNSLRISIPTIIEHADYGAIIEDRHIDGGPINLWSREKIMIGKETI